MLDYAIISLIFVSIFDRAGIPLAFISGLILLGNSSNNLFAFYLLASSAALFGDIIMYLLGIYLINNQSNNLLTKKAGIIPLVLNKASFILSAPITWIYLCRLFNYINQFIPLLLGIKKYSPVKFLLNSAIANFVWFGIFYLLSFSYLIILQKYGKVIAIFLGVLGLIIIWGIIKYNENKNKQRYSK